MNYEDLTKDGLIKGPFGPEMKNCLKQNTKYLHRGVKRAKFTRAEGAKVINNPDRSKVQKAVYVSINCLMELRLSESCLAQKVLLSGEIFRKTERECFRFGAYKGAPTRIGIILESENISERGGRSKRIPCQLMTQ